MNRAPVRIRYVNQVVGGFLLLILILGTVLAVTVANRKSWWRSIEFVATIPATELDGVTKGTPVYILGQQAGTVTTLKFANEGQDIELTLSIQRQYEEYIFPDSVAKLRRRLGGAGEAYLEIVRELEVSPPETPEKKSGESPSADETESETENERAGIAMDIPVWLGTFRPKSRSPFRMVADGNPPVILAQAGAAEGDAEDRRRIRVEIEQPTSDALLNEVENVAESIDKIQKDFTSNFGEIQQSIELMATHINKIESHVQAVSIDSQKSQEKFRASLDELTHDMDQIRIASTEAFGQAKEASLQAEETFERMHTATENVEEQAVKTAQNFNAAALKMNYVMADLQEISPRFDPLLDSIEAVADDSRFITKIVREEARDLPGTTRQTREVLMNAEELINGIENSALLQPHLSRQTTPRLISPGEVQGSILGGR